ncbi:MAG TPA: hypothetical protein VMJ75_29305 [Candidatus Acidoferrales bacterium]|nr:hypothetical protein [Candidatus Acidoferrales bacterium]
MSGLEQFRSLVFQDRDLQRRLLGEREAEAFLRLVVETARERGITATVEDTRAALRQARRSWLERHVL